MVIGHLSEGSFVRNGVVQIPKFDPNSNHNPMPICFRQMTLWTSELSPLAIMLREHKLQKHRCDIHWRLAIIIQIQMWCTFQVHPVMGHSMPVQQMAPAQPSQNFMKFSVIDRQISARKHTKFQADIFSSFRDRFI